MFIDVGHYIRDLTAYEALQAAVSLYTVSRTHMLLFIPLFCLFGPV